MGIFKKIGNLLKTKTIGVGAGGLELLSRLSATAWSKTKMMETYQKSLYVFACVSKIAEKVASIDFDLYQILNSDGDTKEILNHPAVDLLYRVNPFQTKAEFIKITIINLKLAGDAFWFKVRNNSNQVVELWNLRPDMMEIIKDPIEFVKAYRFTKNDGTTSTFSPSDIVHFKKPTPLDDYYGVSPIFSAQIRIDTEEYASNFQRDFFLNNARPDAVIKSAENVTEDQKNDIRQQFEKRHKGVGKNSKVALLEAGLEYQQISVNQKEMDFIESMKFTRDDILVAFSVPKTIVAITDDVNRANAETAMYVFLSETIKPEVQALVEKVNEELIIPDFGENLFLNFDDPTPQNRDQVLAEYDNGIKNYWLMINEIRANENMPPIDGGDSVYMPLSLMPVGGLNPDAQQKMRDAFVEKMAGQKKRMAAKVFKGRELLRQKFMIAEKMIEGVKQMKLDGGQRVKQLKKIGNKSKVKKGILTPLINGAELRKNYADMVNKSIDRRATKLKTEVNKYASIQGHALTLKLMVALKSKAKGKTKGITAGLKKTINEFFAGDTKVWAEFALPFITDYMTSAGKEAMQTVNPDKEFNITDKITAALKSRAEAFGLGVNRTTRDKITSAISSGLDAGEGMTEISDRINSIYQEFPTWRSDLIARTEATAANNDGFIEAYKQSDVATHKEWINAGDDRVRLEHEDKPVGVGGEIVSVGKAFSNGLQYPSEPNCRCVLGPAFEN